jgi:glycosyltransferase involved in cell wall biosynthesis
MNSEEVAGLYKNDTVKCLISLTRGEGFGLPILEAAASGLPVIATSWSGHMDFMSLGKFIPISYKLIDIHPSRIDNRIFIEGLRWAEPNENDFKNKVKKFRKKHQIPQQWAKDLQEIILETHSQSAINEHYNRILMEELDL